MIRVQLNDGPKNGEIIALPDAEFPATVEFEQLAEPPSLRQLSPDELVKPIKTTRIIYDRQGETYRYFWRAPQ